MADQLEEVINSLTSYITESLWKKICSDSSYQIIKKQKISRDAMIVKLKESININLLKKLLHAENIDTDSDWNGCISSMFNNLFNIVTDVPNLDEHTICCKILVGNSLLDNLWQKLNTGSWKNVPLYIRLCFTWTSIAVVHFSLHKLLHNIDKIKRNYDANESLHYIIDVIQICDRGLLMGYSISMNPLHWIAQELHRFITASSGKILNNGNISNETIMMDETIIMNNINNCERPSLSYFLLQFSKPKKPVKLVGICDQWKAISNWKNFQYFKEIAGYRTVPIEVGSKYTDDNWSQCLIPLQQFIDEHILKPGNALGYLAQHELFKQIPQLMDDICVPEYCLTGEEEPRLNIWLGPKGTISPLHHDPDHNILVQVTGQKYIRLYEEDQTTYLYPYEDTLLNNTSQTDVEDANSLIKWPLLNKAKYKDLILKPGEALYIPPRCWHYVRSLSPSCSVSFWWKL